MNITTLFLILLLILTGCVQKSEMGKPTFQNNGNPLITNKFTADPAPLVHDGTLYLYVGHDEYYEGQDDASGGKEFNITGGYATQLAICKHGLIMGLCLNQPILNGELVKLGHHK